jgi:hypothetical protein
MMRLIGAWPTYGRRFIAGVLKVLSKFIAPDVRVFGLNVSPSSVPPTVSLHITS